MSVPICEIEWLSSKLWCGSKIPKRFPTVCGAKAVLKGHPQLCGAKAVSCIINNTFSFRPTAFKWKKLRFWVNKLCLPIQRSAMMLKDKGRNYKLQTKPEGLRFNCSKGTPIQPIQPNMNIPSRAKTDQSKWNQKKSNPELNEETSANPLRSKETFTASNPAEASEG